MSKKLGLFGVLVSLLTTIFLVAQEDSLSILSVTPQGGVESIGSGLTISVTFNAPMVALQATPADLEEGPLLLSPHVPGKFRWLGTRTLTFTPSDTLPLATRFEAKVLASTTALNGQRLGQDYSWSFETLRPRLLYVFPENGFAWVESRGVFLLRFNQPMLPDRISDKIKLLANKKSVKIDISHPTTEELEQHWNLGQDITTVLRVQPVAALPPNATLTLSLEKGLLSLSGNLGTSEPKSYTYQVVGPLRYLGLQRGEEEAEEINPASALRFRFNNPVKPAELAQRITFDPPIAIPDYYRAREWASETIYLDLEFKPEKSYRFTLSADLVDNFGTSLGKAISDSFRTGPFPSQVMMTTGPGVLEAQGDLRFPLYSVNMDRVLLRMGRINPDQLIPLLARDENPLATNRPLPKNLITMQKDWPLSAPRNVRAVHPIEMSWLLKGRRTGLVLFEVDNLLKDRSHRLYKSLLQVTNLGISAKFSPFNNVVWVTLLKDASPVSGAKVEIRDDSNRILWTGQTDESGMAESPGWRELGVLRTSQWEKPRQWVLVTKDDDFAYSASDWGTGIYPWRFGIDYDWDPNPVKIDGAVFTDRNLYRAGETVHLKGFLRERQFRTWEVIKNKTLQLRIQDARGSDLPTATVKTSEFGSFHYDLPLSPSAPLGYYWVSVETLAVADDPTSTRSILQGSFRVEAFRPAEFTVSIHPTQESYVLGDSANAFVHAAYLFGAPMAQQKIQWSYYLIPGEHVPPGYENYIFGTIQEEYPTLPNNILAQGQGMLDQNGSLKMSAKILVPPIDFPLALSMSADVEGPTRQHISAYKFLTVHPAQFYLGIKIQSAFAQAEKPLSFEWLAVTPEGQITPNVKAKVKFLKRQWHSVRKAGLGGRYEWLSEKKDTIIDSALVTSATGPLTHSFTPREAGVYIIRAEATDQRGNRTASETYLYCTGAGYVAWERSDDDRIDLVPDRTNYKPGDVARVMVKSPFDKAQALVTTEREGIISRSVMTLQGTMPVIEIPIDEQHLPNVFVSVILLKGRTAHLVFSEEGEDVGRPAFKIGYTTLQVDASSQRLNVTVQADRENYRPGDVVTLDVRVSDPKGAPATSEVTLAVVDAGVLNLTQYELPDLFMTFYGPRPLSVQTSENRLHIIEQRNYGEKGENRGGGGAEYAAGMSDIELRRRFIATPYWNPALMVDSQGQARVSFKLPDNLTTFKIMAVAQTRDAKFGRGMTNIKVSKPLLLQPSLPRFARLGDRFEAGVVVHNYTGKKSKAQVLLTASGIRVGVKNKVSIKIENGESKQVLFPFQVEALGSAKLSFRCSIGKNTDGLEQTIPLILNRKKETVALFQRIEQDAQEKVRIPNDVAPDLSTLEIQLASSALSQLSGSVEYLLAYPYECLEQKISRMLPSLVAKDLLLTYKLASQEQIEATVTTTLKELESFKTYDGGFSLWRGGDRSWPYVTAYTVYAMLLAKQAGYSVAEGAIADAMQYLRLVLNESQDRGGMPYRPASWRTIEAFIVYLIALSGDPDYGYIELLYSGRTDAPLLARAFLMRAIHLINPNDPRRQVLFNEFNNLVRIESTTAHYEDPADHRDPWLFSSDLRTTAIVMQALLETDQPSPFAEKSVSWLLNQRRNGIWSNTQENFWVLYALQTYLSKVEGIKANYSVKVLFNDLVSIQEAFSSNYVVTQKHVIKLDRFTTPEVKVDLLKQGMGQLYYTMRMHYYPRNPVAAREEGLTILKTIEPAEANATGLQPLRPGELVKVTLNVVAPVARQFVAMEDPLPAGLQPVQISFATTALQAQRLLDQDLNGWSGFSHVEQHDDRIQLFADYLPPGVHTYSYLARIITKGTFAMPASYAEEMYSPEIYGRTTDRTIVVQ